MEKDKNKKSFWEEFFGISDHEVSRVEKMPTEEETQIPDRDEDEKILDVLEGKNKKSIPVQRDSEDLPEVKDSKSEDSNKEKRKVIPVQSDAEDLPEAKDSKSEDSDKEKRKVIPVKVESKDLPEAPVGSYFFVHDGPTLKNLHDLEYYLGTMTKGQFNHHTSDGRNDFASWVRDVLGEKSLALQLEKAKDRESMQEILANFLNIK